MEVIRQFVTRGVFIKDNKVLILNKKGEPHYFLPGGRVESGEGYEEALIREIKEELNKEAMVDKFIGSIEHSFIHYSGKPYYEIGNFFLITIQDMDSDNAASNESDLEFQWKSIDELDKINIKPAPVIELIRHVNSNNTDAFWASTVPKNT